LPAVTFPIAVVINVNVVADVGVVVNVDVRPAIPPIIPIGVAIVRMAIKTVVVRVQVMRVPAD
jgi:hypothetical protein